MRRAGPAVVDQLNTALVGKLAGDKLLRGRKLRVDTTVVEADIDYPTDADLLEQAVRKVGGLVGRIKAQGAARRTRFRDRGAPRGGGCGSWLTRCVAVVDRRWPRWTGSPVTSRGSPNRLCARSGR